MTFDLYPRETAEALGRLGGVSRADTGIFEGYFRGAGASAMAEFARQGRSVSLAAAVPFIAYDAITGGTEAQDRFFRQHDEIFGRAVEKWTGDAADTGAAGQITGSLIGMLLPMIGGSMALGPARAGTLVAGQQTLQQGEELVRAGVSANKALAAGAVTGAALGAGLYVPIFGRTLAERVLYGGAGLNALWGAGDRAAAAAILEGTPGEGHFGTVFDPTSVLLDTLLGAAFGGVVHLSPRGRAGSAEAWEQLEAWGRKLGISDKAAVQVARATRHKNADSLPGVPRTPADAEAHVQRMELALEQLVRDQAVEVSGLPRANTDPDPARAAEQQVNAQRLLETAEEIRVAEGLGPVPQELSNPREAIRSGEIFSPSTTSARSPLPAGPQGPPRRLDSTPTEPSANLTTLNRDPSLSEGPFRTVTALSDMGITSETIIHQPSPDPHENVRLAAEALPAYTEGLKGLEEPGITFAGARAKGMSPRLLEKLEGRSADEVSDYVGGRLWVDTAADMERALDRINETWPILRADNFLGNLTRGGYQAVHVDVQQPNGLSAELQVIPRQVGEIQEAMHKIYERWRHEPPGKWTPEEWAQREVELAEMERQFLEAAEAWKAESARISEVANSIPRLPEGELSGAERDVETKLINKLARDVDAAIREYEQIVEPDATDGGRILSTDAARELSEDYRADRSLSSAVHAPAAWLTWEMFLRRLATLGPGDNVLYTAGGTGAGKTSGIQTVPSMKEFADQADLIYDSNMNNVESAIGKITQALERGVDVQVITVARDPVEALREGALPRAMKWGRTVPLRDHGATHAELADAIPELMAHYADNPLVEFRFVDNTRGKGNAVEADAEVLKTLDYANLNGRLLDALEEAKDNGDITEKIYRAFLRAEPGGVPQALQQGESRPDGQGLRQELEREGQGGQPQVIEPEASGVVRGAPGVPPQPGGASGLPRRVPVSGPAGNITRAFTERGSAVEFRYRLVEVDQPVTSHSNSLKANPLFPADVQPRARDRVASEAQVSTIEKGINPELLGASPKVSDGAPTIADDWVVESGNARMIALRRAYQHLGGRRAEGYRQWLAENAEQFGLLRADVERLKHPVLVRERITPLDRAAFAREANESPVAAMGAAETARADVARMPELERLATLEDGSVNLAGSREFVRAFLESVPPNERPAMMTATGELSQAGASRIRNAIFQRAYGDPELVAMMAESTDANVKNILGGMLRAAPEMAKFNDLAAAGLRYDNPLATDLATAVRLFSQLRGEGMPVQAFLSQQQMFPTGVTDNVSRLMQMLDENSRSMKRVAEALEAEVELAHGAGNPRQATLFGEPSPEELRPPAKGHQPDFLETAAQQFVTENPDFQMRVGQNADGTPITQSAREFMDEARLASEQAVEDAPLFELAASCLASKGA